MDDMLTCGACVNECYSHPNPFEALRDCDDEDDDEERVIGTLKQFSRSVTVGPKVSQKARKGPSPVSRKKMAKIVASIENGTLSLPDAMNDCENGTDVDYIWALMDSGSFVNIANKENIFQGRN